MNHAIPLPSQAAPAARVVLWPRIGLFVGLTFAVTWLLNLGLYLVGGLTAPAVTVVLVTQMLIPAFVAILLETFFFHDAPLYYRLYNGPARWFTYYYLASSLVLIILSFVLLAVPSLLGLVATIETALVLLGSLVALVVRLVGGRDTYAAVGMAGGKARWWLIFGLAIIVYYGLSTLLNALFKLGTPVDLTARIPQLAAAGLSPMLLAGLMLVQAITVGPFLNMPAFFGEEYGWRGFLQRSLEGMGRVRGTFLVGLIWGLWHAPLILMGYNYPDAPLLGVLLMTIFCILMAYVLAYAVYKAEGVWIAAFLHGINNNILPFFFGVVLAPVSTVFGFGVGIYGLPILAVIVLLLLRDPLWKDIG